MTLAGAKAMGEHALILLLAGNGVIVGAESLAL